MEKCGNCRYWTMDDDFPNDVTKGLCLKLELVSDPNIKTTDFINVDCDFVRVPIYSTGCNFGCVHFKHK